MAFFCFSSLLKEKYFTANCILFVASKFFEDLIFEHVLFFQVNHLKTAYCFCVQKPQHNSNVWNFTGWPFQCLFSASIPCIVGTEMRYPERWVWKIGSNIFIPHTSAEAYEVSFTRGQSWVTPLHCGEGTGKRNRTCVPWGILYSSDFDFPRYGQIIRTFTDEVLDCLLLISCRTHTSHFEIKQQ